MYLVDQTFHAACRRPFYSQSAASHADTYPKKINLGIVASGARAGAPLVFDSVRKAEDAVSVETDNKLINNSGPIHSAARLKLLTQKLAFGEKCAAIAEGRIASVQALSGAGSLRVAGEFISQCLPPEAHTVWVSDPMRGYHTAVLMQAGLEVKAYPYYDANTSGFNFDGMYKALQHDAAPGSHILLHACAHNPTGVDPSEEQWQAIAALMKERGLVPLVDSAYQGYASGSLDKDAYATRMFASMGFEMLLCQSFAKNHGLYGEFMGMFHIVRSSAAMAKAARSLLRRVTCPRASRPPAHNALLLEHILGDPASFAAWKSELRDMADRIITVRSLLRKGLEEKGTPGKWHHITDQVGMFSLTGLSEAQCKKLVTEHNIHLPKSGRISLAGLDESNMQYVVDCVDEVVRAC